MNCFQTLNKTQKKGQILSVNEIKKIFDEEIGKETYTSYIYRLLHRKGYRKIMPRSKHPKITSDEAIEASKKLTIR